jgi:hypothetical protein
VDSTKIKKKEEKLDFEDVKAQGSENASER